MTESDADRNNNLSRIGSIYAAVFPVPVAAQPQISRPDKAVYSIILNIFEVGTVIIYQKSICFPKVDNDSKTS